MAHRACGEDTETVERARELRHFQNANEQRGVVVCPCIR
jgi:hypothetical protein